MSDEERTITARDLRSSAADFISALRLGEGMNEELFARLASAMADLGMEIETLIFRHVVPASPES